MAKHKKRSAWICFEKVNRINYKQGSTGKEVGIIKYKEWTQSKESRIAKGSVRINHEKKTKRVISTIKFAKINEK